MRLPFLSVAAVAGALLSAPAQALVIPPDDPRIEVDPSLSCDIVTETELYCMTLALFFEGGSTRESEEGQRHIARVIVERAQANRRIWGGPTICGVVFYQAKGVCQFSFACLPQARRKPGLRTGARAGPRCRSCAGSPGRRTPSCFSSAPTCWPWLPSAPPSPSPCAGCARPRRRT